MRPIRRMNRFAHDFKEHKKPSFHHTPRSGGVKSFVEKTYVWGYNN